MKDKLSKFINVTKRDGVFNAFKKSTNYITGNYLKILLPKRINFFRNKNRISQELDEILNSGDYDRILIWRGSFGWTVPLYQRPQQIAMLLADKRCLVLYEVTRMTDKVNFHKKIKDNLYLIDYELSSFSKLLFKKLESAQKPKYLQLYSTCWDVKKETVDMYINNGFKMLYEYIDDLSPVLAGTEKLPKNVEDIYSYVSSNQDVFVVTSASNLYDDMLQKRGNDKNLILSSNGVDLKHFENLSNKKIEVMEKLTKNYKKIVGYYGALASWFDYDLVKKLAINNPEIAFVLIGIKYDTSFDESEIEKIDNIKFLGPIDYQILPDYAKYFDAAWIPFVINEITLATNPIKVFEYMALKKLVISSDLPECRKYKSVKIAKNYDDYQNYIDNIENLLDEKYINLLKKEANENSWDAKADDIINLLKPSE